VYKLDRGKLGEYRQDPSTQSDVFFSGSAGNEAVPCGAKDALDSCWKGRTGAFLV